MYHSQNCFAKYHFLYLLPHLLPLLATATPATHQFKYFQGVRLQHIVKAILRLLVQASTLPLYVAVASLEDGQIWQWWLQEAWIWLRGIGVGMRWHWLGARRINAPCRISVGKDKGRDKGSVDWILDLICHVDLYIGMWYNGAKGESKEW